MNDNLPDQHERESSIPGWAILFGSWLLLIGLSRLINIVYIQRLLQSMSAETGIKPPVNYSAIIVAALIVGAGILVLARVRSWRLTTAVLFIPVLLDVFWTGGKTVQSLSQRQGGLLLILTCCTLIPLVLKPGAILFFTARFHRFARPLVTLLVCLLLVDGIDSLTRSGLFIFKLLNSAEPPKWSAFNIFNWIIMYVAYPMGLLIAAAALFKRPLHIVAVSGYFKSLAWTVAVLSIHPFMVAWNIAKTTGISPAPLFTQTAIRVIGSFFPLIMTLLIARYYEREFFLEDETADQPA